MSGMFSKCVIFWESVTQFYLCCWPTLQDDGAYEAVPGSDFVITRAAFRDNSSKYYINNRASNFTEVTKKLKGKGVDLDNNRFLILQVSSIALVVFYWNISTKFVISLVLLGWSGADFTDEAKSSRTSWWGFSWISWGYNRNHQICWNDWRVKQAVSVFFLKILVDNFLLVFLMSINYVLLCTVGPLLCESVTVSALGTSVDTPIIGLKL